MKTAIRMIEQQYCYGDQYRHFYMQILTQRFKNSDYFDVAGSISFQTDKDRETSGNENGIWYGRTYEIKTSEPKHLVLMAKIAKHLADNCYYDAQPKEVFNVLGGIEYIHTDFSFVPKSCVGMNVYKMIVNGEYYQKIIAPNDIIANNQLEVLRKKHDANAVIELKPSGVIAG